MKQVSLWVLVFLCAVIFVAGFAVSRILQGTSAYAQVIEAPGAAREYIASRFKWSDTRDGVFVIDTRLKRMAVYRYDINADKMILIDRRDLERDFRL